MGGEGRANGRRVELMEREKGEETGGDGRRMAFSSALCLFQLSTNITCHVCTIWCLWYNQVGTCVRLTACCTTATCLNFRATTSGLS